MTGQPTKDLVLDYYDAVDSRDIDRLVELFASDATYERPGYAPLVGIGAIEEFYRTERVIETGTHTLSNVLVDDDRAAVEGAFEGQLRDGSDVSVRFADFFFIKDAQFMLRHTYFFAPSV